jgi:hypothetical protein
MCDVLKCEQNSDSGQLAGAVVVVMNIWILLPAMVSDDVKMWFTVAIVCVSIV